MFEGTAPCLITGHKTNCLYPCGAWLHPRELGRSALCGTVNKSCTQSFLCCLRHLKCHLKQLPLDQLFLPAMPQASAPSPARKGSQLELGRGFVLGTDRQRGLQGATRTGGGGETREGAAQKGTTGRQEERLKGARAQAPGSSLAPRPQTSNQITAARDALFV